MEDIDIDNHYIPLSLINKLCWDGDSYVQFLNEFILISGTIGNNNSLKRVNSVSKSEVQTIRAALEELRERFPRYTIIIGADVEAENWKKLKGYHSAPNMRDKSANYFTIYQKKTILQPQLEFGWDEYKGAGDFILSSSPL